MRETTFFNMTKEFASPKQVKAQPLLREHVDVLVDMFTSATPALRLVRGASIYEVLYIFGDASGLGFGSNWLSFDGLRYRFGVWGDGGEDSSSNYREMRNLVETLERVGLSGDLQGKEIFVFTDNATAESIAHKGSSTSPLLYDLVVRLYKLAMKFNCLVRIFHVAGSRMIAQGADGLSRGDLLAGSLNGKDPMSFIPTHLSAIQRSPSLKSWVTTWLSEGGAGNIVLLKPEDWFTRGHDIVGYEKNIDGVTIPIYEAGTYIWDAPPGAARVVIEEIRQARHKRQKSTHVFLVPRLMMPEWRSQLYKSADLIFSLPAGHPHWDNSNHEPLTIAIVFP